MWVSRMPLPITSLPRYTPNRGTLFAIRSAPQPVGIRLGAVPERIALPTELVMGARKRGYLSAVVSKPARYRLGAVSTGGASVLSTGGVASGVVGAAAGLVKTNNPTVNYAATGAAIGTEILPGIGTVIGAAIGAIGGALIGSKRPESELWDKYKGMAGSYRGTEYDPQFLNEAFVGLFRLGKNTFPPRAKGGYGPGDDARFIDDMAAQIAAAVRDGRIGASDDEKSIFAKVVGPWIAQWGQEPNADWRKWENQIVTDKIAQYIYDIPSVPTSYTTSRKANPSIVEVVQSLPRAPQPAPAQPSVSVQPVAPVSPVAPVQAIVQPKPVVSSPVQPVTVSPSLPPVLPLQPQAPTTPAIVAPAPQVVSPAAPPPAPTAASPNLDVGGLVSQLLAQGASQQQAYLSALSSLQAQGVQATPQVKEAVASEVANQGSALPPWVLPAAGAAIVLVLMKRKRAKTAR